MTPDLTMARKQIGEVADQLEALQFQLLGIQGSLPEPAAEIVRLLEMESLDPATELRAVIGCVLADWIGPAIRDLRDVVEETGGATGLGDRS